MSVRYLDFSTVNTHGPNAGTIIASELAGSGNPTREPYNEASVTTKARGGDNFVELTEESGLSFVATLIPLFKLLLQDVKMRSTGGQWMFTRLDTTYSTSSFLPLRLELDRVIGGVLARGKVMIAGISSGELYFSWVDKE